MKAPTATELRPAEPPLPAQTRRSPLRRVAWIVLFAIAGGLIGAALGLRLESRTEAQVAVVLRPLPGNAFSDRSGDTLVDMETEGQLTVSDAVLRRVAQSGGPIVEVLRRQLSVNVVDNAEVLELRYRGRTPAEAISTVALIAEATLAERGERALTTLNSRRVALDEQVAAAEAALQAAGNDPVTADPKAQQQRLAILSARVLRLQADRAALATEPPLAGSVISATTRAGGARNKARLGLIVGCVAGAAVFGAWVGAAPNTFRRQRGQIADDPDPV